VKELRSAPGGGGSAKLPAGKPVLFVAVMALAKFGTLKYLLDVAVVVSGAAQVLGPQVVVAADLAVQRLADAVVRRPGEAGVQVHDAADGPAAGDLLHPVVLTLEDDRLPQGKDLERLADVEVRAAVGGSWPDGKYSSS
jgi:hypothetical protein